MAERQRNAPLAVRSTRLATWEVALEQLLGAKEERKR
jgi:hypothetical protein